MVKKVLFCVFLSVCCRAVSQTTLSLHYDRPATYFEETFVVGNGNQGAIIYGGVQEERISLNDITLWTGEPDLRAYNPDGYRSLPEIRKALADEDYRLADGLQHKDQGNYSQNYQPVGSLTITETGGVCAKVSDYRRILDISRAVADISYSAGNGGGYSREYFASAPDSVIIIRLKADGSARINRRFAMHSVLPHTTMVVGNELIMDGYAAYTSLPSYVKNPVHKYDSNRGVHYRTIIHVLNSDGSVKCMNDDELQLSDCTDAIVVISTVTSFNGADKDPVKEGKDYKALVRSRVDNALKKTYAELLSRHEEDYKCLFNRFSLELGTTDSRIAALPTDVQLKQYTVEKQVNPDLEELYMQYGRYLLISCSRTQAVPANLQGLWNEYLLPPWSSNYTSNINVEENYWPAETANLSEMHQPMLEWIGNLSRIGHETAKAYYNVNEGWCLAHNSDIWGLTCPVGLGTGDPNWANWNMGGAWVSTHLWEHYLFTMDKDYLQKAYPVLKGAADFCMAWLLPLKELKAMSTTHPMNDSIKSDADRLITAPATSPENKYLTNEGYIGSTMFGGAADIAMIRECLLDARAATVALKGEQEYIKKIDNTLSRLLEYKIGKDGSLQEWYYDWRDPEPTHRHQSHLFGLYPGHHITVTETPELTKACKRALEIKGDETTGWSTGWRINLQARLHDGEQAYHIYRKLLKFVSPDNDKSDNMWRGGGTYPNLLDAHAPFQIDGNFGGTAGVIEMLCQSSCDGTNVIELMPAVPEAWKKNGSVKGVCCRGGYVVDFSWKNGKVVSFSVTSRRKDSSKVKFMLPGGKTISVNVKSGVKKSVKL